jgi:beta-galactosidase
VESYRRTYFTERGIAVRRAPARVPEHHEPPEGSPKGSNDGSPKGSNDGSNEEAHGPHESHHEIDLFAGAMHYWRLARNDWPACLAAMKSIGLGVVDTYVPWGVHEVEPGQYDWRREYDLTAFLDQVAHAGMYAIIRPGPHINAELPFFGFPRRILENRAILAVSGRDTPVWLPAPTRMFPVPSYAARAFKDEVAAWFAAVGEIVAERLAPHGPVIALQVDNEAQMFFRLGAYDHDYHPDALEWWHELSQGAEPPRAWDPGDPGRCAAWVRFKEDYLARALTWMGAALDDAGITGVARFHNLPPSEPTLINLPRTGRAIQGLAGMDFYHQASDYLDYRRRALYLVGSAAPLPFAPEVGVGGPPWLLPMSAADQESILLGILAAGVRAFNLYMTVDRDRWYGAAISEAGELRPPGQWMEKLLAVLADIDWTALRRRVPVALILSRADARFGLASSAVDPLTPVLAELLQLGPGGAAELALDQGATLQRRWMTATERALDLAQVPYELVDEDCSRDHLARYRAIILPTIERVDRALWTTLHQLAQHGTAIIIGPGKPVRDDNDQPLGQHIALPRGAGVIRSESIDDLEGFAQDLIALAGDLPGYWLSEQEHVDCSVFVDQADTPRVVFVANRAGDALDAEVIAPEHTVLVDPFTDEELSAVESLVTVALAPHQVRMLLVN